MIGGSAQGSIFALAAVAPIAAIPVLWSISLMSDNPAYNALMDEVCAGFGWCGAVVNGEPSHVDELIPAVGPVSAEQFVDWLFHGG